VQTSKIVVDLESKVDSSVMKALLLDIKFTQLETTDECLIREYSKIINNKDRIYILDRTLNSLFAFSSEGEFIGKLNAQGRGPNDYLELSDFIIDGDNIDVLDSPNEKIMSYDLDLSFKSQKQFIGASYMESDGANNYYAFSGASGKFDVNVLSVDTLILKSYLKKPNYSDFMSFSSFQPLNRYNNHISLTRYFDYNVYSMNRDTCLVKYSLDFGLDNFDFGPAYFDKEINTVKGMKEFMSLFRANKEKVTSIDNFIETDSWISFYAKTGVLYNKNSKEVIVLTNLDTPFNILSTPKSYYGGYFLSNMSASNIINCWRIIANNSRYSKFSFLKKFTDAKIKETDNDWIIQYKLKKK
jgi:hypothetical protein